MASEIRVDKINSLSGVGTVTLSPTGVDIAGITTVATLKATTGIVTTLTTTTGIVTTLTTNTLTANSTTKVGSGVTLSPDGDIFATGVTTATTFSGSGASLTNLNASNIASGTVPTARLGSGTASSSTFLRGDSTFAAVTSTTINNNTDNYIITGTGTANELQGESEFTFDGSNILCRAGEGGSASLNLIADQGDDNGDGWKIQSEQDENDLTFKSNISGSYVDKLKLKSNGQLEAQGDITLTSGADVVVASGQGIDFSSSIAGSGSSREAVLDDYEQGIWTPSINSGTFTAYSTQWYVKIGRLVTCYFYVYNFSDSSSNTQIKIGGLPFARNSNRESFFFVPVTNTAGFGGNTTGVIARIGVYGTTTEMALFGENLNGSGFELKYNSGSVNNAHFAATFSYYAD